MRNIYIVDGCAEPFEENVFYANVLKDWRQEHAKAVRPAVVRRARWAWRMADWRCVTMCLRGITSGRCVKPLSNHLAWQSLWKLRNLSPSRCVVSPSQVRSWSRRRIFYNITCPWVLLPIPGGCHLRPRGERRIVGHGHPQPVTYILYTSYIPLMYILLYTSYIHRNTRVSKEDL